MQSTCEGHPASFACNDVHKTINISSQTPSMRVNMWSAFTDLQQKNGVTQLWVINILDQLAKTRSSNPHLEGAAAPGSRPGD